MTNSIRNVLCKSLQTDNVPTELSENIHLLSWFQWHSSRTFHFNQRNVVYYQSFMDKWEDKDGNHIGVVANS